VRKKQFKGKRKNYRREGEKVRFKDEPVRGKKYKIWARRKERTLKE
jgi:hypothetical protein